MELASTCYTLQDTKNKKLRAFRYGSAHTPRYNSSVIHPTGINPKPNYFSCYFPGRQITTTACGWSGVYHMIAQKDKLKTAVQIQIGLTQYNLHAVWPQMRSPNVTAFHWFGFGGFKINLFCLCGRYYSLFPKYRRPFKPVWIQTEFIEVSIV